MTYQPKQPQYDNDADSEDASADEEMGFKVQNFTAEPEASQKSVRFAEEGEEGAQDKSTLPNAAFNLAATQDAEIQDAQFVKPEDQNMEADGLE